MKRFLIILLAGLCATAACALAVENHALLIGIGAYKAVRPLDGPPNDVAAVAALLRKYNYKPEFIHTLVDDRATKQAILQAMKALVAEVKPGDYVFFYYSGHGTSFYDSLNKMKAVIGEDTGASLPVDFNPSSLEAFGRSILLGRELRPYFTALDAKAQVFAVYDSCYSQDSMKALPRGTPKYVSLDDVVQGAAKGDLDDLEQHASSTAANNANAPLPYKHLIAISAAKRDQAAIDIGAEDLKRNPTATFDGKPHGQLTNALLIGLNGAADKNHDGVVTHEELFNYINEVSAGKWRHNPKLRVSENSQAALEQPALTMKQIALDNSCSQGTRRQARVSAPAGLLKELNAGFVAVDKNWDVKAVPQGDKFLLYDAGGVQLNDEPMPREKALARLRAEPELEQLTELRYCRQSFNLQLESDPADQGKYVLGQQIQFFAKVDRGAYVLAVDIDQEGGVTVIYPFGAAEPLKAGKKTPLGLNAVRSPFGVDLIKAFAFESKPAGFDKFVAPDSSKTIYLLPGNPAVKDLLQMLAKDAPDRSETRLQLTTSKD